MTTSDFFNDFSPLEIPVLGVQLPKMEVAKEVRERLGLKEDADNFAVLRALCSEGFKKLGIKKGSKDWDDYGKRIKYELEIVNELGFTDYFLLVWKVINFCKEQGIPVGMGRGSAVGSVVLFLIGVTKIDPIKSGLYFERFISKTRAKKDIIDGVTYYDGSLMPDVDMDICYYRRYEVIDYLRKEFNSKTAKILTFNTLSSKLLVKEVGKVLGGKSEEEMTDVTSMIPKLHGIVEDVDKTYETVPEFKAWCDENKMVFDTCLKLQDLIKNKGAHPSGILISYDALIDSCPTELTSGKNGEEKELVSSYDMSWVQLFTIKMDVLGLRGVSVVDDACKRLNLSIYDIDLNSPDIYRPLQDLKQPHGLFQIEADLGYRTCQKVKPKSLADLSAILALARPGAMQFIDQFALYSNTGTYEVIHPFFEDILKETGGVALYQEQLMKMANKIGFSLEESEILRRIVGKKKVEEMAKWEQKVYDKCIENKLPKEVGEVLWKIMDASKDYSFNKSHTYAYAALTAITVFLKFTYPQEFYLSLLRMTKHEPDPIGEISKIQKEMASFGIELLPPSLQMSKMNFSIEGKDIRFGLSSIKGIAEKAIEKLEDFKREHANKFELFQSAKEAGLNISIVAALIQAGALHGYGDNRSLLVYEAQLWNSLTDKEKEAALGVGGKFNFSLAQTVKELCKMKDEKGKPIIKTPEIPDDRVSKVRFNTIRRKTEKYKAIYEQNRISQPFANWWYEKKLLGYNHSNRLMDIYIHKMPSLIQLEKVMAKKEGTSVTFIGIVDENAKLGTSRKKSRYAKIMVSDETAASKVMIFNDALENCKSMNQRLPKAGDIVIVQGSKKGDDTIFANFISIQQNQIYTKFLDLKHREEDEEEPKESKDTLK